MISCLRPLKNPDRLMPDSGLMGTSLVAVTGEKIRRGISYFSSWSTHAAALSCCRRRRENLKGHSFFFQLLDPCRSSLFGLVALIVLIERTPKEFATLITLRLAVRVVGGVNISDQLGTGSFERRVQFLDSVAEIVAV